MENQENKLKNEAGIGGWLIIVLIGLIVTPIRLSITLVRDFVPLLNSMSTLDAYPKLQTVVYIETASNLIFVILAIVLLFMMFNKDKRFPKLMIIVNVSNLIFVLADATYASQLQVLYQVFDFVDSSKEIIRAIVGTAIWVPYMLVSKRVKLTFIK